MHSYIAIQSLVTSTCFKINAILRYVNTVFDKTSLKIQRIVYDLCLKYLGITKLTRLFSTPVIIVGHYLNRTDTLEDVRRLTQNIV